MQNKKHHRDNSSVISIQFQDNNIDIKNLREANNTAWTRTINMEKNTTINSPNIKSPIRSPINFEQKAARTQANFNPINKLKEANPLKLAPILK